MYRLYDMEYYFLIVIRISASLRPLTEEDIFDNVQLLSEMMQVNYCSVHLFSQHWNALVTFFLDYYKSTKRVPFFYRSTSIYIFIYNPLRVE